MFRIRNQVAVVGSGFSEVGRHLDRTVGDLVIEACRRAVEEAGLTFADIDGLATMPVNANQSFDLSLNTEGLDSAPTDYIARTLGLKQVTWFNHSILKGMIGSSLVAAIDAVAAGVCNYALIYRGLHSLGGGRGSYRSTSAPGDHQFKAPYGFEGGYIFYTLTNSRYAALYGVTREKMAKFIVSNRKNAAANPNGVFYEKPLTAEDYLNDPVIADPCSRLDFDMAVDGAGAFILTTAERARDLRHPPAYVTAYAQTGFDFDGALIQSYELFMDQAEWCAKVFWDRAGLTPKDVDCVAIHDCISYWPPVWLEAIGFCGRGEGLDLIESGTLPVNRFGGSLGMGRLHGMPTYIEATRQVQGTAAAAQVPNATTSLSYVGSPVSGGALVMFSNDPTI